MTIYTKLLLFLIALVLAFHSLVLIGIVPHEIVWGGRINKEQVWSFELASMLITIFLALVLLMKEEKLPFRFPTKLLNIIILAYIFLFVLNTIGNLMAKSMIEKWFSVLTALFALLLWFSFKSQKQKTETGNKPLP